MTSLSDFQNILSGSKVKPMATYPAPPPRNVSAKVVAQPTFDLISANWIMSLNFIWALRVVDMTFLLW